MKFNILTCDTVTPNNHIYPSKEVQQAIETYKNEKIKNGTAFGTISDGTFSLEIDLSQITHKVTDIYMDNGVVICDINLLSTPKGKLVQTLINNGVDMSLSLSSIGIINKNEDVYHISVLNIIDTKIIPKDTRRNNE